MNIVMRGFIVGFAVFIIAACEIGPIDSVDIVDVICRDTAPVADMPELSEYPFSYTITVNYNSSLFRGELLLMFNTDDPDVFQENGIYGWNSREPPNRFTAEKGEGTHTFDVYVKKPLWMAPPEPEPEPENETLLDTVTQRNQADDVAADGSRAETIEAESDIPEESLPPENEQAQEPRTGTWKAVVYLRQKFGEDKMVQSESAVELPLPQPLPPPETDSGRDAGAE